MQYPEPYTEKDIQEAVANGIDERNFKNRVNSLLWTVERAKTQPVKKCNRNHGDYPKRAVSNGISESLYYLRVNKRKWSQERACTEPPMTMEQVSAYRKRNQTGKSKYGEYLTKARSNGICKDTFYQRVWKGWSLEKASTVPPMNKRECALYRINKGEDKECII